MERLDKVLAGTGRWSRREVKDLVRQGRVRIDGVTARTAEEKLDPDAAISVDGQPVETERFTYVMLHKPAGVLSATEDSRQSTVLDLLRLSFGKGACPRWDVWTRTRRACCC